MLGETTLVTLTSVILILEEVGLHSRVLDGPGETHQLLLLPLEVVTAQLRVLSGGERPGLGLHSVHLDGGAELKTERERESCPCDQTHHVATLEAAELLMLHMCSATSSETLTEK